MNQSKRGKSRGGTGGGFNRGRNRGPNNVVNSSHAFNQNDEPKSHIGDIYKNPLMIHSITKLLGCQVTVQTCNGVIFDGILKTLSPKGDVTLEVAHKVTKRNKGDNKIEEVVEVPTRKDLIETLVLGLKHIVYVAALNVDLDEVRKDTFTDSAISSRLNGQLGGERQLQKWEDPSAVPDESLILDDSNMKNGLDPNEMFAANEKFGGKSTFKSDMLSYTTPVEGCSKELQIKADRLAKEIQQENNFRERAEYDSGRTEEELFSAVVRNQAPLERSQPPKPKPQHTPAREENKREVLADSPGSSSPKPQRVQLRDRDVKLPDGVGKPIAVVPVDQAKVTKEAPVPTPPEEGSQSPVKPLKVAPKVVDEEQSGISILSVKPTVKEKPDLDDLKQFSENFKLGKKMLEQEEQKKKDTAETVAVKDQPTASPANEPDQQKESTKTTEQKPTDTPLKTEEKSTFKWNINAKEFKPSTPSSPHNTKTPPLQSPQPTMFAPSPTSVRVQGYNPAMIRHSHNMKPRSIGPGPRQYYRTEAMETGGPPISAAAAAGSPIIAPGHYPHPQFIAVQPSAQFPSGMVQQIPTQGYGMIHPGHQGGQQHYMTPQTVGIPSSQGQGYQDSTVSVYGAPSNIQMAPNPSYPGSPQPSPTTTGQFHLQYIPHMIPQQGNQPHIPQGAMMASPGQPHVFVVPQPQQGGQQHVTMHGITVSGQGNPMLNQFVPGPQQQHYPPGN